VSSNLRQRDGDQPLPVPNSEPDIQSRVITDIVARRELGISRYGTALQCHNGRDALRDLYEELLDGAMYARQLLAERDALTDPAAVREQVDRALGSSRLDCARCQHCDRQVDAVMSVIRELMTAAAASELALREQHVRELVALREHAAGAAR
jgi:hypothetical protein